MAVTEVLRGLGSWGIQLSSDTPKEILDALKYFGHITVHTGQIDPRTAGDSLLASSRYAGIYRGRGAGGDQFSLIGPGMAAWLGDEDGKGEIFETSVVINHDFNAAIPLLLPPSGSIHAGTIFNIHPGVPFQGTFQYLSPREAIDYLCQTVGGEWRVNNNGTLDAGLESDLFVVVPKAAIRRRGAGNDMFMKSLPGIMSTDQDVNDFTTRTLLLASGTEGSTVTATADISPGLNPFVDLFGNPVKLTRIISESDTDATNAPARAQLQLNRFTGPRNAVTMSTSQYDLKGDVAVGDYLWAYDPEVGIFDLDNEVVFRGERFWPMKLRLTEMTWPVVQGMSVAYRGGDGTWLDLTPYLMFEQGDTTMVVGGYNRSLFGGDGGSGGTRVIPDTSVPDVPTWNTSLFRFSSYQSPVDGNTRAQIELNWNRPLNVDGSIILDGDHYEVRYRSSGSPIFPATHIQMSARTHAALALGTQAQPITYGIGAWLTTFVPFDDLTVMLQDLPTNMPYEAQVRAVDGAKPPNAGDWSVSTVFQTSSDTIPPVTPAPPSVAASALAIQITHTLGAAAGGTYNLDLDLHHLEVHGGSLTNFAPDEGTLLGRALANAGSIFAKTPVVASFNIDNLSPVFFKVVAVDNDGNKSDPSSAVAATAQLIDDAHITTLTASKITAGTLSAQYIIGGWIRTATAPSPRVEIYWAGITAYNINNVNTFWVDSLTGNVWMKGQLKTGEDTESRVVINPGQNNPKITFYPQAGFGDHVDMTVTSWNDPRGNGNVGVKISALSSANVSKGGELEFGQTGAKLGHFNNTTGQWAYYWIDEQSRHALRGTFNASNYDAYSALVVGQSGNIPLDGSHLPLSFFGSVSYGGPTLISPSRVIATAVMLGDFGGWPWSIQVMEGTNQSGFDYIYNLEINETGSVEPVRGGFFNFWAYRV